MFTATPFEGNPLAVFPQAQGLTAQQMQAIAREFNLSETVFIAPSSRDDCVARVRIFSPVKELDFAGHPTVGAAHLLDALRGLPERFALEENVGAVRIAADKCEGLKRFWLTTPPVVFAETLPVETCAQLLGLEPRDVAQSPPQFASAGSPLLFVQLSERAAVDRAVLDASVLPRALGSLNSGGTFIFARKDTNTNDTAGYDVYSRMFAPQIGIAEDPATGGATGPLAAYMLRYGLIPPDAPAAFTSEQGVKMGRRSTLYVRISHAAAAPLIEVGGTAVVVANGSLAVLPR